MKTLKIISDYLLLTFFIIFVSGIFITWTEFKIGIELPINDLAGFVVDSDENIYIGDNFYSMIQKYNKQGDFIGSIKVKNTKGKSFRMSIDEKNNIIVESQVNKNLTVYPYYDRDDISIIHHPYKTENLKNVNRTFITLKKIKFVNINEFYPSIWKITAIKKRIVEQNVLLKLLSLPTIAIMILIALLMKLTTFILNKIKVNRGVERRIRL